MMTAQEYIDNFKNRFGNQTSKDGQLIRDMNDFEVLDRALRRYPGDREEIDQVDLDLYYDMNDPSRKPPPPPPKTGVQKRIEELTGGLTQALKTRRAAQEEALGRSIDGEQSLGSGLLQAAGEGAGFIGDVGFEAVKAITPEPIRQLAGGAVEAIAGTEPVQGAMEAYGGFKEDNPELAGNIEAVGNLAGILPAVGGAAKGAQLGAKAVKEGAEAVVDTAKAGAVAARDAAGTIPRPFKPNLEAEAMDAAIIGPQGKRSTIAALERSGRPGGYAPDESFVGRIVGADKYVPTKRDMEVAEAVTGIVRKSNTPAKNIANINNKIAEISETEVRPILRQYPSPFNVATYANRLKSVEMPDFIKSDETLARTYDMVRNRFIEVVRKGVKNKEGLWEARKDIDDIIEQQFGAAGFNPDKYSALQKAMLDMRRATNDFIAEGIPNDAFRKEMQRMSRMYEAKHNIALDNYAIQNKGALQKWMANNPRQATAVKALIGAGALTGGATFLFGD